jgi:hypothetical protein
MFDGEDRCSFCHTHIIKLDLDQNTFSNMTEDEKLTYVINHAPENGYDSRAWKRRVQQQELTSPRSYQKKCKCCGSTSFTPIRKKWNPLTGFATNKIDLVCNQCGNTIE